jgi:aminopeptidase N
MRNYLNAVQAGAEVPIMRHTDYAENGFGRSIAAYSKPGMLMHTLRHMMGEDTFDAAYRDYIDAWKYKHPMPWDFFRMMEEAAGTDLDWFWQAWYYDTATLDQAIASVGTSADGPEVTVTNDSDAVMPVELQVTLADGSTESFVWPVNVWAGTREVTRTLPVDGQVEKIVIDPDAWYPDTDRSNNSWERPAG